MQRRIIIIAGPNGAGKTTCARSYLQHEGNCLNFINADLIAAGLAPFKPETVAVQAGRLMILEIKRHVENGENFAFETTLSGRSYSRQILDWQNAGYTVDLIFLKLRSISLAKDRVKTRVTQGGHHIPDDVISRRFQRGWENFENLYRPIVNHWELYENSGNVPILIDQGGNL